jgi:hypothetical protein
MAVNLKQVNGYDTIVKSSARTQNINRNEKIKSEKSIGKLL